MKQKNILFPQLQVMYSNDNSEERKDCREVAAAMNILTNIAATHVPRV